MKRYFPEPVVSLLKSKSGEMLSILDTTHETPELMWTLEMQKEIRLALIKQLVNADNTINWRPELREDFAVEYKQISEELYVGDVYVRLYMRQPTFKLSNPIRFLECLISRWEDALEAQLTDARLAKSSAVDAEDRMSYALIVGKEDFLSLVTSCIVCSVRAERALVDHILMWGFPERVVVLLQRALDRGRRGMPVICILRLLQLITDGSPIAIALLNSKANITLQLTRVLDVTNVIGRKDERQVNPALPVDAALTAEVIKKIVQFGSMARVTFLGQVAMSCGLVTFLMEHVISKNPNDAIFSSVRSPVVFRVHCVEALKILAAADATVQSSLEKYPCWNEYRDVSQDLFITVCICIYDDLKNKHFILCSSGQRST